MTCHHLGYFSSRLRVFSTILCLLLQLVSVLGQPASPQFKECAPTSATEPDGAKRINVTGVYSQIITNEDTHARNLKFVILGQIGSELEGFSNSTGYLATLFTTTSFLTFVVNEKTSSLCDSLRPPSPLEPLADPISTYCPLSAGSLALGVSMELDDDYALMTLVSRIRIVDSSSPARELACLDIQTTPLAIDNTSLGLYGIFGSIFWGTIALTAGYWVVTGIARISAAWDRGTGRVGGKSVWGKVERVGFVLASALSGEKFATSPALLRFSTPSARDILFQTQWCAMLAMVAIQWPDAIYPILSNTAWSTLVYNVTLVQGQDAQSKLWRPAIVNNFTPPSEFADQISDPESPLFLDTELPNQLLQFPDGAAHGMPKFAAAVGIRQQDLFGTCLALFLIIIGGTIAVSALIALVDWLASGSFMHGYSSDRKDLGDPDGRRPWWKRRLGPNSFHGNILYGNLVRILILFHLPVTIFSCLHISLDTSLTSTASRALAGLSFAIFSILIPAYLLFRVGSTSTRRLYDATRTLLALGPLYNEYQQSYQLFSSLFFASNLALGIVVGCGQKSGTAQAILILIIEVLVTLTTSIWLPWMHGAYMGVISFIFCVARIVAAVLLVILAPPVNIGHEAGGWIAYAVLCIQAVVYFAFTIMLVVKILEGLVRIVRHKSFTEAHNALDSGLFGALGCCGSSKPRKRRRPQSGDHSRKRRSGASYSTSGNRPQSQIVPESYLKPEQASIPYREDSDDEGFIMSSWKPDPGSPSHSTFAGSMGNRASTDPLLTGGTPRSRAITIEGAKNQSGLDVPPPQSSGFARVGGGRAHIDTPYAILQGRQAAAPGRSTNSPAPSAMTTPAPLQSQGSLAPPTSTQIERSSMDSTSAPIVAPVGNPPLPKGAKPPFHSRTRSQTAVIEYAGGVRPTSPASTSRPPSAGKGQGRPGSAGKGGRPSSSGKNSRPPSSSGNIPRPPSRDQGLSPPIPTELGGKNLAAGPSSTSSTNSKSRGWFGLLGTGNGSGSGVAGNASSDEDDDLDNESREGHSGRGSNPKRGLWTFGKRRGRSESDILPIADPNPAPAESAGEQSRSFVVLRPNQSAGGVPNNNSTTALPTAAEREPQSAVPLLVSRTPLSPDSDVFSKSNAGSPPPSSYVPPLSTRRLSNPTT